MCAVVRGHFISAQRSPRIDSHSVNTTGGKLEKRYQTYSNCPDLTLHQSSFSWSQICVGPDKSAVRSDCARFVNPPTRPAPSTRRFHDSGDHCAVNPPSTTRSASSQPQTNKERRAAPSQIHLHPQNR